MYTAYIFIITYLGNFNQSRISFKQTYNTLSGITAIYGPATNPVIQESLVNLDHQ
jgi:hypothetical protein